MRIAFITPEVQPFSKTGGLGDVAGALPWALARMGAEVTLITPYYSGVARAIRELELELRQHRLRRTVDYGGRHQPLVWRAGEHKGVRLAFCEHGGYFQREGLYVGPDGLDYADNPERFIYLQRSAIEYMLYIEWIPDVLHCHDWQTALVPVLQRTLYAHTPMAAARCLLTLHNLGYQGIFPPQCLVDSGIGLEHFHIEGLEYHGQACWLKAGIVFADRVNTVSPSYAREILAPEQGMGLDGVLRAQQAKLSGILNGIDTADWDPATDPLLPANYSRKDPGGKAKCKAALQAELGLKQSRKAFLVGMITRFDRQKGVSLALETLPRLFGGKLQFAMLGSGDSELQERAVRLALEHPGSAAVRLGFDPDLARRIYAGCDALLMPSLYEPCGLNQMYAQRYGTVPIVHATGGLRDTVRNATKKSQAKRRASGFTFLGFNSTAMESALRRALRLYRKDPRSWRRLMRACMALDNSWAHSAQQYLRLYEEMVGTRPGPAEQEEALESRAAPPGNAPAEVGEDA